MLGLSGGIDSALVACLAVDALGAERVTPSIDALALLVRGDAARRARRWPRNLGVELPRAADRAGRWRPTSGRCAGAFDGREPDITEENLQARIRGNLLMALSNKFGWLVLTTGNKSEISVGYSTLYGDTAGGFAVIKDVPKTLVYGLVRYRNERGDRPIRCRTRSSSGRPSAELRPDQRDEDSLPPYEVLDPILEAYVEEDVGREQLVRMGFDREAVERVIRLVDLSEYKRRQAPPGIKITTKSFGRDRRMPITNRYSG